MILLPLHHHDMESHIICDKTGKAVIELSDDLDSEIILSAVNAYDSDKALIAELVKACREALDYTLCSEVREQLQKALDRAEEQSK